MPCMYKGSRFAQVQLFVHLVLPSKGADPWRVALKKGWEACTLARRMWCEGCFSEVWNKTSGDGPLVSLGQLSQAADGSSAADAFRAGGPEWQSKPLALAKLDEALQRTDLE